MTNLAIIPARGGSKRIPKKNIRNFLGKPIIAYSIEAALHSKLFSEVMVSTDDEEIAAISRQYNASIPFLRSTENSDDFATTADVIAEVLQGYSKGGKLFTNACCIYPTAPFISKEILRAAYEKMKLNDFSSVFPVVRFGYPIQRALREKDGAVEMINPENVNKRSQDLEPAYHDSGQFYWLKVNDFLREKKIMMKKSGCLIISEKAAQDIDDETDWQLAELKFQCLKNSEKSNS